MCPLLYTNTRITFQDNHKSEQLLRVASSYYGSNRDINGVNFSSAKFGDYIRFSNIPSEDLTTDWANPDNKEYTFFDL